MLTQQKSLSRTEFDQCGTGSLWLGTREFTPSTRLTTISQFNEMTSDVRPWEQNETLIKTGIPTGSDTILCIADV